jgi:hypothetical protein
VVLENKYGYGRVPGGRLDETLPLGATSAKGRTRAAMTQELLATHRSGDVDVAIGRASDYFVPAATHSAIGELVLGAAVAGARAQIMGDPDRLHTYSFTPDVAAGLIALGTDELVKPVMREYLHTLSQFTDDWEASDRRSRDCFGDVSTRLDDALESTIRCCAERTAWSGGPGALDLFGADPT